MTPLPTVVSPSTWFNARITLHCEERQAPLSIVTRFAKAARYARMPSISLISESSEAVRPAAYALAH